MKEFIINIPEVSISVKLNKLNNHVYCTFFGNKYKIYNTDIKFIKYGIELFLENQKLLVTQTDEYDDNYLFVLGVKSIDDFLRSSDNEGVWLKQIPSFTIEDFQHQKLIRPITRSKNINLLNTSEDDSKGLREPQQCALHSIHAYWPDSNVKTQTIVLPTGTGKTETMLAAVISKSIKTTLVILPRDDLREQIGAKFKNWGILRYLDVCSNLIENPTVCLLKNSPINLEEAQLVWSTSNIIISTPKLINNMSDDLKEYIVMNTDLVIFDEAHHEGAEGRRNLSNLFKDIKVLQFTATPYRNDKKQLSGQITYHFSLKRAQQLNLFSKIEFESICKFDTTEADGIISKKAIERLRFDRNKKNNKNHILLVRVNSIPRAEQVFNYYKNEKDLNPIMVYDGIPDLALKKLAIKEKKHQIILAVEMLSEGFDLPEIKIAALHDNHKSLPVFLQFIGRFTRNRADLGQAYVIANIDSDKINESMKEIWNSKDWNNVISYVADEAVKEKVDFQTFLEQFTNENEEFPLHALNPTLSVVAFKVDDFKGFNTSGLDELLPGKTVFQDKSEENIYVCIKHTKNNIKRLSGNDVFETNYNLYLFYYSEKLGILFVSGGNDKNIDLKVVKYIIGEKITLLKGDEIFRVLSGIERAILTNRGVYPTTKGGAVVYEAQMGKYLNNSLDDFIKSVSTKANFACYGYENGIKVTMGCTRKGRFWSMDSSNIKTYVDWCERTGEKILDDTIEEQDFIKGFMVPIFIEDWPEKCTPISMDRSGETYEELTTKQDIIISGRHEILQDFGFSVESFDPTKGVIFSFYNDEFKALFQYTLLKEANSIEYISGDKLLLDHSPIEEYLHNRVRIWLDNFEYIEGNAHYQSFNKIENATVNDHDIIVHDFQNVTLNYESQGFGPKLRKDSLQYYIYQAKKDEYDLIVNDDGANELADLIGIKQEDTLIYIDLYHLKFAHKGKKSTRIDNFYELVSQAQKMIRKIAKKTSVFDHIKKRHTYKMKKYNFPRIIKGTPELFNEFSSRKNLSPIKYRVFIVQPAVTPNTISTDVAILINSTIGFLKTFGIETKLICSVDLEGK